jgi:TP901 family phage tail tape measure protein
LADRVTKVTLTAAVGQYIADMQRAQTATKKTGTEAEQAADRFSKQSDAMREVGAGVTAIGAVAAVAFGLAVARFAEFDAAMSNVKAATQESAENMGLLREAALEAGASTVFTATEAAGAIEELGKAGLTTQQILDGGLNGALDLAAAGQLSVADAANIAAVAVKQFNLEGGDVPHVADLLAAGAGKAVGSVSQLGEALNQAGLVANGAGQSIEDTTGVLSAFADAGLIGSDAGTSLKAAIIALQAPTDKARAVMDEYNLSFYDANGQMRSFDEIAGQLESNLGGLTDEQRNAALATIFGNDALRVANVLYDEGADGIRKYIDQTNDSGYAAKVAADRLNNLSGDVEKLGGALDTALIKSGSGANDMLRALVQGATGLVDAVGQLPTPVLGAAGVITGLVGAIALAGGAALLAVPKIVQFKTALSVLNVSGASAARTIGLASGALAVAGAAFAIWAQRQAEATATAAEFEDSLEESTGAVTDYTRELVAKKLAEADAFAGAKNAGISQKELTDAILEGGDAVEELRQRLYDYANGNPFDPSIANSVNTLNHLSEGLERADQNFDDQAAAAAESADSTENAAAAYQEAADKAAELQSNLRQLIDAVNEANGVGQDAVSSNAAYQTALAGISAEVQRQRDEYEQLNGTLDGFALSLDESTVAGSSNADMLSDVAGKAQAAAAAQYDLDLKTMSSKDATDKYMGTLAAQRQAFIDSAVAAGYDAGEVQKLADKVFALPSEKEVEILAQTAAAQSSVEDFIRRNAGRRFNVYIDAINSGGGSGRAAIKQASGGYISGPGTGTSDSIPAMLSNGEYVINAAATRRNRALLDAINNGAFRGYANGGEVQPRYASSVPSRGGGGPVFAILDPAQMRDLQRNIINNIMIDRDAIGWAANESNANSAWRGGSG